MKNQKTAEEKLLETKEEELTIDLKLAEKIKEKLKLYKLSHFLLKKYSAIINEKERKTVSELKSIIDASNLTLRSLKERMVPNDYVFEKDYLKILDKFYRYLQENIEGVKLDFNLNFWLTPEDILELKISDDEDIAIFLCSFMQALGDENAKVIIAELSDLSTRAFVLTEFRDKHYLLDVFQKKPLEFFSGKKVDVIENYSFEGKKINRFLFSFNSKDYENYMDVLNREGF
jgi:hypothetical protein